MSKVILLFDFLPCVVVGVILVKAVLVEVEISMVDFVVAGEEKYKKEEDINDFD